MAERHSVPRVGMNMNWNEMDDIIKVIDFTLRREPMTNERNDRLELIRKKVFEAQRRLEEKQKAHAKILTTLRGI